MRNKIENKNREILKDVVIVLVVFVVLTIFLSALSGCTVSVGAEGRAFYPENDPREGFFDLGGIDGIFSGGGGGGGFNTLGGN